MAPPQASAAPAGGSGSKNDVAAAIAAARREKRAAAAAAVAASMAPRMQSQVQKWAKMTAELGSGGGGGAGGEGGDEEEEGDTTDAAGRPKKKTKTSTTTEKGQAKAKAKRSAQDALPFAKQLRAPHRRDRYASFGIGAGVAGRSTAAAAVTGASSLPPTCLLCLVRFDTRQQLRDHEALSTRHRRRLRDGSARKGGLQRYAKTAEDGAAEAEGDDTAGDIPSSTAANTRPPVHIKRLPRRRGDLAPTYTSYAVPVRGASVPAAETDNDAPSSIFSYHGCLLCRRRFRSRATLRLHERESALHRARTRDPAAVASAVAAVNKAADEAEAARKRAAGEGGGDVDKNTARPPPPPLIRPLLRMRPAAATTTTAGGTTTIQYRDRARERRLAFGGSRKRRAEAKDTAAAAAAAAAAASAAPSKGAALLSKMGWTAGQGLGAQGGGLTEALAPTVYRSGVGLGAQGGKLGDAADVAARRTESTYADFVEQTQEAARQRYLALDRAETEAAAAREGEEAAAAEHENISGTDDAANVMKEEG